jgi:hypothetical protein
VANSDCKEFFSLAREEWVAAGDDKSVGSAGQARGGLVKFGHSAGMQNLELQPEGACSFCASPDWTSATRGLVGLTTRVMTVVLGNS